MKEGEKEFQLALSIVQGLSVSSLVENWMSWILGVVFLNKLENVAQWISNN